ncbi:MAG: DUF3052 family protein [Proteobacteria bacterium]|nr:DUF3052 family protein [Pseudomonadota bacterium]
MTAGYSGTPLAKKLSLKDGMRVWRLAMPEDVAGEIAKSGLALCLLKAPSAPLDCAHLFVTERAELARRLAALKPSLAPGGFVWVSWPKKASKVPTDMTEDVIRAICLPMGLVDVKVCAVDAVWSGLKLMIRKS